MTLALRVRVCSGSTRFVGVRHIRYLSVGQSHAFPDDLRLSIGFDLSEQNRSVPLPSGRVAGTNVLLLWVAPNEWRCFAGRDRARTGRIRHRDGELCGVVTGPSMVEARRRLAPVLRRPPVQDE